MCRKFKRQNPTHVKNGPIVVARKIPKEQQNRVIANAECPVTAAFRGPQDLPRPEDHSGLSAAPRGAVTG